MVLDTGVLLSACVASGLRFGGSWQWWAPTLVCSEVLSALHEAVWRGQLGTDEAVAARAVFAGLPVRFEDSGLLGDEAWRIADELGLVKTYDAEFLALARRRGALLVTADARLRRGADRLGFVVDPAELEQLAGGKLGPVLWITGRGRGARF